MAAREVQYVRVRDVVPAIRNAKNHDLLRISGLIRRFGFVESVVRDGRTGRLVAGHGRLEALLTMEQDGQSPPDGIAVDEDSAWLLPVSVGWASRSDGDAEALGAALNRAPELGGWDHTQLASILAEIDDADPDLRALIGWDDRQLTNLLTLLDPDNWDPPAPAAPPGPHPQPAAAGRTDSAPDAGAGAPQDLMPRIELTVSSDVFEAWHALLSSYPGRSDTDKLIAHLRSTGHLT
ncbi:hypothetical protein [Frankia sp. AvcI1]|uniref:hypothetical protein n=1 Tax=Frankia sp. AvcI1 TaxID=573496 RepID=UPI002117F601|nr:hypothetical protein [Frankia sp. AvcI1]